MLSTTSRNVLVNYKKVNEQSGLDNTKNKYYLLLIIQQKEQGREERKV